MADRILKADGSSAMPDEMRPRADLQTPLHASIASELLTTTPEHWSKIRLRLLRKALPPEAGIPGEGVAHTISSPEGHKDVVFPSERLLERTHQLDVLFQEHGHRWRTAEYLVQAEEESWSWEVAFTYDENTGP